VSLTTYEFESNAASLDTADCDVEEAAATLWRLSVNFSQSSWFDMSFEGSNDLLVSAMIAQLKLVWVQEGFKRLLRATEERSSRITSFN
jgi:hypothetical protein